jgi:hypothetical protein
VANEEVLKMELQQAIETARHGVTLLVQATGFFVAVDSALVTVGLTTQYGIALLIASFLPIVVLFTGWRVMSHAMPAAYVAVQLEQRLIPDAPGLAATYVGMHFPEILTEWTSGRREGPPNLPRSLLMTKHSLVFVSLCAVQLALFLVVTLGFGHRTM